MACRNSSIHVDTIFTVLIGSCPLHILLNRNIHKLLSSGLVKQLILELIVLVDWLENGRLSEGHLNSLNTFPIEVRHQYGGCELLIDKEVDNVQATSKILIDIFAQFLELTSQSILNGLNIHGLRNLYLANLLLQICNLVIDALQVIGLQIVGSSHFLLEVLQSSNLRLKRLGSSVLGNQGNEFLI